MIVLFAFSPLLLPTVHSQKYGTITTQVSTVQVSTSTVSSSVFTSLSQPQVLIAHSFRVNSTVGTNLGCAVTSLTFEGSQGQFVSGNFTSAIPLDFYIMQNTTYQNWLKSGSCAGSPDAVVSIHGTNSSSFGTYLPSSGSWDLVLVNYSNNREADGFIAASLANARQIITQNLLTTVTQTGIVQSEITEQVPTVSDYSSYIIGGIIIAAIAILAAVVISKRRR